MVGPSGSGKTTLASNLAAATGLPHTEMDSLWWEAEWTEAGPDRLRDRLRAVVDGAPRWVIDGNYFTVGARDVVWPLADTVVWLDVARGRTIARIVRRSIKRTVARTELWAGNREQLGKILGRDELLRFAWREFPKYRRRYSALQVDPDLAHLEWVRLRTPRDARRWLATVASDRRAGA